MSIMPFSYTPVAPAGYVCTGCGATNCKLWRQYNTMTCYIELKCAKCSGADISTLDDNGTVESTIFKRGEPVTTPNGIRYFGDKDAPVPRTDRLDGLMPAVPTEDGETFWGYTSVPAHGCRWWKALPSSPQARQDKQLQDKP